jgi:hypothetical protein
MRKTCPSSWTRTVGWPTPSLWLVFNATHLGDSGGGFTFLGGRNTPERAKELADRSIRDERVPILIEGWTPPSREMGSDPGIPASGHLERLLWHGVLPSALERAAHAVESAALTDGENWLSAIYLAAKLVETVERIGLLCVPQPAEWLSLAGAWEIYRSAARKSPADVREAMTNFRRQLTLIKPKVRAAPV